MSLPAFYMSFLEKLNFFGVDYLIVGGQAVNFHGYSRATMDMDIWINKTQMNLIQLEKVFVSLAYSEEKSRDAVSYYSDHHKIDIPKDQHLIEILDSYILKSDFTAAFENRVKRSIDDIDVFIIDLDSLLEIKSKSSRLQDLADVEKLKEINSNEGVEDAEQGYTLE